jgi:6-phosphogluconolactonase
MGEDGHTASFFPGGDRLAEALDPDNPALVVPMRAQGAGEPRITLTLPLLLDTRLLVLHIEGENKRAVLEAALAEPDPSRRPVSAVLQQPRTPVEIYWAP